MKNLEKQFSEDLSITPSSNSVREYAVSIPVDLLIDILSRVVSGKSIARFRCVSKLWSSIIRCPYFTERFLTNSWTRPQLLFTFQDYGNLIFYSSPQPQNPDDNSSLVATPYKYFPDYSPSEIAKTSAPLRGLVFLQRGKKVRVIYNPVTGESITLPKVKAAGIKRSYLGFDPISKQFKVLCMTWPRYGRSRYGNWSHYGRPNTQRILTLETGKCLWRTTQDPILPHYVCSNDICINGVLYYRAAFREGSDKIVCFDFRFDKFSFINLDEEMDPAWTLTLFNYKGKLGAHQYINQRGGRLEKFALWVLEDAGKHRWSKRICQLPPLWGNIVNVKKFVGMTSTGEIVFSPYAGKLSNPLCIFYYNIERNTVTRINIPGFEAFERHYTFVHICLDYVENLKVM